MATKPKVPATRPIASATRTRTRKIIGVLSPGPSDYNPNSPTASSIVSAARRRNRKELEIGEQLALLRMAVDPIARLARPRQFLAAQALLEHPLDRRSLF